MEPIAVSDAVSQAAELAASRDASEAAEEAAVAAFLDRVLELMRPAIRRVGYRYISSSTSPNSDSSSQPSKKVSVERVLEVVNLEGDDLGVPRWPAGTRPRDASDWSHLRTTICVDRNGFFVLERRAHRSLWARSNDSLCSSERRLTTLQVAQEWTWECILEGVEALAKSVAEQCSADSALAQRRRAESIMAATLLLGRTG